MKKKDIIKFIKEKKKLKYHWEKEGKELIQKINTKNYNKEELKKVLSILILTEDIPNNIIIDFWLSCSGAKTRRIEDQNEYRKLVKAFNYLIGQKHPFYLYLEKKIASHLNGTFDAKNIQITPKNIEQLRDILYAFAIRNTSINFCQGLNAIVGYLLQMTNFREEETFYLFLTLMENILPYDYYLFGIGVEAECNIIKQILEKYEPKLMEHLKKIDGISIFMSFIIQYVICLLNYKMNQKITSILFNCFFGFALLDKKDEVFFYLHKIILGIFRLLKDDILKCKTSIQFNNLLSLDKDITTENLQIIIYYTLFDESKDKLDIDYIKNLRKKEIDEITKNKKWNFSFKNDNNIKCNIFYLLCIEEGNTSFFPKLKVIYKKLNDNKKEKEQQNNIIINTEEDDYEEILKTITIERREHHCQIRQIVNEYNYHWEKEGKELMQKIIDKNYNKEELKKILSILLLSEDMPKDLIIDFWLSCSGAKTKLNEDKGEYKKLVKGFNILVKNKHPFYLHLQKKISVDLNRSFNYSKIKVTPDMVDKLRDVLYAFATRNVSINYCQGLNGIVAYFLQMTNFKEEETFYLFLTILENVLPYDYYLFGIGVEAELNIIMILLEKYETELFQYLNQIGGVGILFSIVTQFVTSLFIFRTDRIISTFAFNCFLGFSLLDDSFFYFYKIILGIFKSLEDKIMRCADMKELNDILALDKEHSKEDIQRLIYHTLFDESIKLDVDYAKKIREEEIHKIIKKNKYKFKFQNNDKIKCNLNYPICVEECNVPYEVAFSATYTNNNKDKDNNDNSGNNINDENDDDDHILKNIVIERRKHFCQ